MSDPKKANDRNKDQNFIETIVLTNYIVKSLKLIVVMVSMTLFVGFFWFLFCDIRLT